MKPTPRSLRLRPLSAGIAIAGLVLTAGLTWAASSVNRSSDSRLLQLEVKQVAATVAASLPSVQSQLNDCLLVTTDTQKTSAFKRFSANKVLPEGTFASLSLWEKTATGERELSSNGTKPLLVRDGQANAFFAHVHPSTELQVTGIIKGSPRRLGYAEMPPGQHSLFVYAESVLPSAHRLAVPAASAFNDMNFALYFGTDERASELVEASVPTPIRGLHSSASVPFGDASMTIEGTPTQELAGGLSNALPWIVLFVGLMLAVSTATTVEYVLRRRRVAEQLAADNERLYVEQRNIAGTLQRALLPEVPSLSALEVAARYLPGVAGIEVGGDWFDVIPIDDDRCMFVVGDVSGRGLGAATTMASLRFATRAYVSQGDEPGVVLAKLSNLLDFDSTQRFATVLIGKVDIPGRRLTLASAGHFPPLIVAGEQSRFVEIPVEAPVGISKGQQAPTVTADVPPGATVIAFTDGLVERRGENLDISLARLRRVAMGLSGPVDASLDRLAAELIPAGANDDVVILGLRWRN